MEILRSEKRALEKQLLMVHQTSSLGAGGLANPRSPSQPGTPQMPKNSSFRALIQASSALVDDSNIG